MDKCTDSKQMLLRRRLHSLLQQIASTNSLIEQQKRCASNRRGKRCAKQPVTKASKRRKWKWKWKWKWWWHNTARPPSRAHPLRARHQRPAAQQRLDLVVVVQLPVLLRAGRVGVRTQAYISRVSRQAVVSREEQLVLARTRVPW